MSRKKVMLNGKWTYRYRAIIEKQLGRKLHTWEHVHHRDEIIDNDKINNLEVLDISEHRRLHTLGHRHNVGIKNGRAKLTEQQIIDIRTAKGKEYVVELARKYKVSESTIWRIQSKMTWGNLK